jgi:hypothetical protein
MPLGRPPPAPPQLPQEHVDPTAAPRVSQSALNDIGLHVESAATWLDEVRATLTMDGYFGQILAVLDNRMPDLGALPPKEG